MHQGQQLSLQQQQRLVLTPELRQALTVLQLPVAGLEAFVQEQLLENPVLEVEEEGAVSPGDEAAPAPAAAAAADPWEAVAGTPEQWLDYLGFDAGDRAPAGGEDIPVWSDPVPAQAPSLAEHLLEQLALLPLAPDLRRATIYLVYSLDERGCLPPDVTTGRSYWPLDPELAVAALRVVQSLDPPGIGARSLGECLLLQWRFRWPHLAADAAGAAGGAAGEAAGDGAGDGAGDDPARLVPDLIRTHLEDLAAGRLLRVAEALGVSVTQVQAAVDRLRQLNPRPSQGFGHPGDTRYIVPDVTVERAGAVFVVMVNEGVGPRLRLSASYRELLRRRDGDPDTRHFLEGKFQSALWLMRSIEQRRLTLQRVTEAIVDFQREFFAAGPRYLRPLTLRQVADTLGLHESTVSRCVAGKFAQTPHGVHALKFFFSSGVAVTAAISGSAPDPGSAPDGTGTAPDPGTGISAESVRRRLRDLVTQEDPHRPLSDQALTAALSEQGIQVARRTVAKYREEAGIPPSSRRRRY